jgi:hypothetical protein
MERRIYEWKEGRLALNGYFHKYSMDREFVVRSLDSKKNEFIFLKKICNNLINVEKWAIFKIYVLGS